MRGKDNPWRYPFADIFMFTYDEKYDILAYNNVWRQWVPGKGFTAKYKWPNGTELTKFGDFEMRVSVENTKYLQGLYSTDWYDVGVTQWYDHYNNRRGKEVAFYIPDILYGPAQPFTLNNNLSECTCREIIENI